jgi:FkbM family methyltransferase
LKKKTTKIRLVFEVGSRDALDAIFLGHFYKCPVYAFECHPQGLEICYHNVTNYPYVTVVPLACWNETKLVPFYPVIESHGSKSHPVNIGASSILVARKDGCDAHHIQGDSITVQAVRLDEWMIEHNIEQVDLLCMDTQGTTLQVLQGMGKFLEKVKYIITEVYLSPSFEGEALYPEISKFLTEKGFYVVMEPPGSGFSDVVFINGKYFIPH